MPLDNEKQWFRMGEVAFFKVSSVFKKLGKLPQKVLKHVTKNREKVLRRVLQNVIKKCKANYRKFDEKRYPKGGINKLCF